jgi:hypothetical protein
MFMPKSTPRQPDPDLDLEDEAATDDQVDEQVDWSARYKGLQKTLSRKEAQLLRLQQRVNELESAQEAEAGNYEAQVIELRAQLKSTETKAQTFEQQLTQLNAENAKLSRKESVRKVLGNPDNQLTELIPWFEAEQFVVPEDANEAAILAKAQGFKKLLGSNVNEAVQESSRGTRPTGAQPPSGGKPSTMSVEEMRDWLFQNPLDSNYESVEEQYFNALGKPR